MILKTGKMSLNTLAIETSAGVCSCALLNETEIIEQIHVKTKEQQITLMPCVEMLFKQSGIKKRELSLIAVDVGPGAFTALRIGVATAKTLAHALNVPAVGVNSLYAILRLTYESNPGNYDRVIIMDARRSKLFASVYFHSGETKTNLDLSIDNVLYYIKDSKNVLFAGNGVDKYNEIIKKEFENNNLVLIKGSEVELSAEVIGKHGIEKYKKSGADNLHALTPVYVRDTDAVTKGK